jgi:hypothetical protein
VTINRLGDRFANETERRAAARDALSLMLWKRDTQVLSVDAELVLDHQIEDQRALIAELEKGV